MPDAKLIQRQLLGLDTAHLVQYGSHFLHRDLLTDLLQFQQDAAAAGFQLTIASAHRSYQRQLAIWNAKASGLREVLDDNEQPTPLEDMSAEEKLFAILRWSALPGASRHHWGTDLDVYDAAAAPEGYRVQLTLSEVENGGVFERLHNWLDEKMVQDQSYGFYRPYTKVRVKGEHGVAPEPWHLSHDRLSEPFRSACCKDLFIDWYRQAKDLALRTEIIDHFDQIYDAYIDPNKLSV